MTLGTETEYIRRDDESEALRLGNVQGVGDTIYLDDNDIREYSMNDFGLHLSEEERR